MICGYFSFQSALVRWNFVILGNVFRQVYFECDSIILAQLLLVVFTKHVEEETHCDLYAYYYGKSYYNFTKQSNHLIKNQSKMDKVHVFNDLKCFKDLYFICEFYK